MRDELLVLYTDGLCEPNPGTACYGWVAIGPGGQLLAQRAGCLGRGPAWTNNVCEYQAVLRALRWAYGAGYRAATVRTDSLLLINQATGLWACHAPALLPLRTQVRKAQQYMRLTFEWVPREENTVADALSRAAYRAETGREAPRRLKARRSP